MYIYIHLYINMYTANVLYIMHRFLAVNYNAFLSKTTKKTCLDEHLIIHISHMSVYSVHTHTHI